MYDFQSRNTYVLVRYSSADQCRQGIGLRRTLEISLSPRQQILENSVSAAIFMHAFSPKEPANAIQIDLRNTNSMLKF